MEVELKLLVDDQSVPALSSCPALAAGRPSKPQKLKATYYDTPELSLWRQGVSLRVRKTPAGLVQTVKVDEAGGEMGARGEWEWPVATERLDLGRLDTLPEAHRRLRDIAGAAGPVFTTEIERRIWTCDIGDTVVEASLDRGAAIANGRRADIAELELELKAGPKAPLFGMAIDLVDRFGLRYGSQSKADRGYGLLTDDLPPRHSAGDVRLEADVRVTDAFPQLLNAVLRSFAAEMPLAARNDIEGVHRLRAAIRKTRSLLVLFGPELDPHASDRFNHSLRELGRVLGRGRDWDVFLTETLPRVRAEAGSGLLEPLGHEAEAARDRARAAVTETMNGMEPTRLLLGLAAWVADDGWFAGAHRHRALRQELDGMLGQLERKVRRRLKRIDSDEPAALHEVRKSMKKLRYAVDFTGSLYRPDKVDPYLDAVKSTLSALGRINDAAVAAARTDELAPRSRPDLAPAAAVLLAWSDGRKSATLHKLDGKLRGFRAAKRFWR